MIIIKLDSIFKMTFKLYFLFIFCAILTENTVADSIGSVNFGSSSKFGS